MPNVFESLQGGSQLAGAIDAGLRAADWNQQITFTRYQRVVLPLDGYVFWLTTGTQTSVAGSLHYSVDVRQAEDETIAINRIVLSTEQPIQEFNAVAPNILWIATLGASQASQPALQGLVASPVLFAFSSRGSYFKQADLHHYVGIAVQPPLLSQIVGGTGQLPSEPIVSNSLPIWIGMPSWIGIFAPTGSTISQIPVYPSFVVPQNAEPPYIAAHIPPETTIPLQAYPAWDQGIVTNPSPPPTYLWGTQEPNSGASSLYDQPASQLMRERVRLTFYGLNNEQALSYYSNILQYCLNTDGATFGIVGMPAMRDEKRIQTEIVTIAMKKTLEIDVSYYQAAAAAIARRLILQATIICNPQSLPLYLLDSAGNFVLDSQGNRIVTG